MILIIDFKICLKNLYKKYLHRNASALFIHQLASIFLSVSFSPWIISSEITWKNRNNLCRNDVCEVLWTEWCLWGPLNGMMFVRSSERNDVCEVLWTEWCLWGPLNKFLILFSSCSRHRRMVMISNSSF